MIGVMIQVEDLEQLAGVVDVIDVERQVADVAPARVFLRVPVVGELDLCVGP